MLAAMDVVTAPDRRDLGDALADRLDGDCVVYEHKIFPDGERYVRVEEGLGSEVVLLGDTRPNTKIVESLIALDACREAGADEVALAVPYLAYARQDRSFNPGEGISARALCQALATGASSLVTVDLHTETVLDLFDGPTTNALAAAELSKALGEESVDLVLAPDAGARRRAGDVAGRLDLPFDHLEKTRVSATEVDMAPKELDVTGATVAIVDDIISTGGTMAKATGKLLAQGADRVLVAATHGIFAGEAEDRLEKAGVEKILVTDSVPTEHSVISCAGALSRGLRRL